MKTSHPNSNERANGSASAFPFAWLAVPLCCAMTSCSTVKDFFSAGDISDPATGDDHPAEFEGTMGTLSSPSVLPRSAEVSDIDVKRGKGFDRFIFYFRGYQVPGYEVKLIEPPILEAGTGQPVEVDGAAFLQVRLTPAQAHDDDDGTPTIKKPRRELSLPNAVHLVERGDFAGNSIWVIGLNRRAGYRVMELSRPPRIVVDVKHR